MPIASSRRVMSAISPVTRQALQLGIKDALEGRFRCTRLESAAHDRFESGERITNTIGYRCEWPKGPTPAGFGKLRYLFSVHLQTPSEDNTTLFRQAYLMWEGRLERWENWRQVRAFDVDLDGRLDTVFMLHSEWQENVEYRFEAGRWVRIHLTQKTPANTFELEEILTPAQEGYTQALILGGLLVYP